MKARGTARGNISDCTPTSVKACGDTTTGGFFAYVPHHKTVDWRVRVRVSAGARVRVRVRVSVRVGVRVKVRVRVRVRVMIRVRVRQKQTKTRHLGHGCNACRIGPTMLILSMGLIQPYAMTRIAPRSSRLLTFYALKYVNKLGWSQLMQKVLKKTKKKNGRCSSASISSKPGAHTV